MIKKVRNLAVKIGELPYRAHTLDSDSLGKIFGGECAANGTECTGKGKEFCCLMCSDKWGICGMEYF
jgi:hypothetical protein